MIFSKNQNVRKAGNRCTAKKRKSKKYIWKPWCKIERMVLQKYFLQNMPLFGSLVEMNLDIAIEFYINWILYQIK